MAELDDASLKDLIRRLDEGVPHEGAVALERDGGGDYGDARLVFTANRRGYLRLGIEYLKAAFAEPRSEVQPHRVDIDTSFIGGFQEDGDPFDRVVFERREDLSSALGEPEKTGVVATAFLGALALFLLASLAVGCMTIIDRALGLLLGRY